jgi:hypothetical protein
MNLYTLCMFILSTALCITKKVYHNYYINVFFENRRNRKILNDIRKGQKNKIENEYPLVSVLIPTYNRGKLLTGRTIPSILGQSYQNFEVIIVGDHVSDDTGSLVECICDKRIKFFNLSKRGNYPTNPHDRWLVAGTVPRNKSIELCSGDWIAPLDDDDEFSVDHIEVLLNYALKQDYEMVYGKVKMEVNFGEWIDLGEYPLRSGGLSHSSILYSSNLKFFKYNINCWKYGEPGDWNMWHRMENAGVRIGFLDKIVGKHYLEKTQKGA